MKKPIFQITPFSLLDYPGEIACIVWFAGCNMRCGYCYNVDIVRGKGRMAYSEVLQFLDSRKNLLDAVVLSGGESTMHQGLENFIYSIKQRNLLVKVDTNGSNPLLLSRLIGKQLIDYVALDFKGLQDRFYKITGSDHFKKLERSLDLLLNSCIQFEIRTTVHSSLLDEDYLLSMADYLTKKEYKGKYFLQAFFNDSITLAQLENDYVELPVESLRKTGLEVFGRG